MPEQGYIDVLAYTSNALIPLENVAITVTSSDGTALAMRLTDRNGGIKPISIPVPDISNSLSPNPSVKPFTSVDVYARLEGFEQEENKNLQVFPNVVTRSLSIARALPVISMANKFAQSSSIWKLSFLP